LAGRVPLAHRELELHRPADGILDAVELDQGAVAHRLEKIAVISRERRPHHLQPDRRELGQRAALIRFDEAGVPRNVDRSEHRQPARRHTHLKSFLGRFAPGVISVTGHRKTALPQPVWSINSTTTAFIAFFPRGRRLYASRPKAARPTGSHV